GSVVFARFPSSRSAILRATCRRVSNDFFVFPDSNDRNHRNTLPPEHLKLFACARSCPLPLSSLLSPVSSPGETAHPKIPRVFSMLSKDSSNLKNPLPWWFELFQLCLDSPGIRRDHPTGRCPSGGSLGRIAR